MEAFLLVVGVGLAFALFQVFVSNPIAQRMLPTKEDDGFGRRMGYVVVHRLVLAGLCLLVVAALALFS